jgi:hypothetical protein
VELDGGERPLFSDPSRKHAVNRSLPAPCCSRRRKARRGVVREGAQREGSTTGKAFSWFWRQIGANGSSGPLPGSPRNGRLPFRDGSDRMVQRDLFPLTYTLPGIGRNHRRLSRIGAHAVPGSGWCEDAGATMGAELIKAARNASHAYETKEDSALRVIVVPGRRCSDPIRHTVTLEVNG